MSTKKKVGTPLLRAKARKTLGKRKGQSRGVGFPKGYYVKAGVLHKESPSRDRLFKSKTVRKKGQAKWRGDMVGCRI